MTLSVPGSIWSDQGEYAESEKAEARVLAVRTETLVIANPKTTESMESLAEVCVSLGR